MLRCLAEYGRYIKNKVLEDYVNGKVGEFGAEWRYSV